MPWRIEYKKSVIKTVRKLDPQVRHKLKEFLEGRIAHLKNPRSVGKALTGTPDVWRYRVGHFRILCQIKDQKITILVLDVGHRSSVYKR